MLLGHPPHPRGHLKKLRDAHLPSMAVPVLFVQSSRDAFGTPDKLRPVLASRSGTELFVVDGGDHSFGVWGKNAPTEAPIHSTVHDTIIEWCRQP